jgi:hypothetical protein
MEKRITEGKTKQQQEEQSYARRSKNAKQDYE